MEKKYTLQDLAALLAERESLPLEQAEDFVRSFFELTEEGLLKDSFVKVTGFGTFKLVEVSERESVNINTGERFQISGHNKISFTPDGTLRELVNRPFAHFTTVTLNDKTPEAALEEAGAPTRGRIHRIFRHLFAHSLASSRNPGRLFALLRNQHDCSR